MPQGEADVAQGTGPRSPLPMAQQARSQRTRQALVDAGLALLDERGAEALTVSAVSVRARVATGTVYRRFGDKDGLLSVLQEEFTSGFGVEFAQRMSRTHLAPGADAATAVDLAVRALADTFRAHERLLRVFVLLGLKDQRIAVAGDRASHDGGRHFQAVLHPHASAFTHPEPEDAIDVAYRLTFAACMQRVVHGANAESPRPLSWADLTNELSRAATSYLLGSLPRDMAPHGDR